MYTLSIVIGDSDLEVTKILLKHLGGGAGGLLFQIIEKYFQNSVVKKTYNNVFPCGRFCLKIIF